MTFPPGPGCASAFPNWQPAAARWWLTWTRSSFIDSAGLAALVGAAKRAAAHGGSLHVVCARPQIRQLFRLTGLDGQIPLARTLDATLKALATTRTTPR